MTAECLILMLRCQNKPFSEKRSIVEIRDKLRYLAHNKKGWGHFGLEKISCFSVSACKWCPAYTSLNNCLESFLFSELPQTWAQAAMFACSCVTPLGTPVGNGPLDMFHTRMRLKAHGSSLSSDTGQGSHSTFHSSSLRSEELCSTSINDSLDPARGKWQNSHLLHREHCWSTRFYIF